jgi:membrane-bound lytic murein transglycosylase B
LQQLTSEGFEPGFVQALLDDKRWELSLRVVERNLIYRESKASYAHFLNRRSTTLARDFLEENRVFLQETEGEYGVDKEVIVAILLIESSFGLYPEKYRIFNALSSLSQANHPEMFRVTLEYLEVSYPDVTEDYLRERAERKSRWAFQELKALLKIGIQEDLDLLEVKGSFAGAFGLPQFIPTSYLRYGADGNGDRIVQLHDRYDAVVSVANYLKAHGWKPKLTKKERMKVLFRYNRSRLYGETVLKCAGKLKSHQVSSTRSHQKAIRDTG